MDKIAVIGLGYVGLPLAHAFSFKYKVVGFDIASWRIEELKSGYDRTLELSKSQVKEAIENSWSVRALERQISKLYYERLLASQEKAPLKQEAKEKTKPLQVDAKDYLRDPYIFDFLNIDSKSLLESEVEQALIDNLQQFLLELGRGFAFCIKATTTKCRGARLLYRSCFLQLQTKMFFAYRSQNRQTNPSRCWADGYLCKGL